MSRGPFQVLVIPFRSTEGGGIEYAAIRESGSAAWRGLAGQNEEGESSAETARRLALESGLPEDSDLFRLVGAIPVPHAPLPDLSGPSELPQYSFGVDCLQACPDSDAIRWCRYEEMRDLLQWPPDRDALRELATGLGQHPPE